MPVDSPNARLTDTALSDEEIVKVYGMRWDIETFFKCSKS
jgi:hypothetical protein